MINDLILAAILSLIVDRPAILLTVLGIATYQALKNNGFMRP